MAKIEPQKFDLTLTGILSLDFANTVDWRTSDNPKELLNSFSDLVRWGEHTKVLTEQEGRRLLREAARRPSEAASTLLAAKDLREMLFRIFSAAARGSQPEKADLEALNARLQEALSHLRVGRRPDGFSWEWSHEENRLDWMLWPVARSAAELLVSGDALVQVRECANEGCGWLFLDTSRNRSRRWCSMKVCGNRAKARRHYEQARAMRAD